MIIGVVTIVVGYLLMSGGGSDNPNEFNADAIFSFRRITLAPLVCLAGYGLIVWAIMKKTNE